MKDPEALSKAPQRLCVVPPRHNELSIKPRGGKGEGKGDGELPYRVIA